MAAGAASAQYRVPQNGDRLDANNRIGSGGSNGPTGQNVNDQYRARNGNAVVTGNVTGGAAFSGYVPYLAPGQFNDFAPGSGISNFQSVSSGVSASGNEVYNNAGTVRPYYNARHHHHRPVRLHPAALRRRLPAPDHARGRQPRSTTAPATASSAGPTRSTPASTTTFPTPPAAD